jgi:hypothetical protein
MYDNINMISLARIAPFYTKQRTEHHTLFALPPSLLRNIIQRSQLSQTATATPTIPATTIPLPKETLGE